MKWQSFRDHPVSTCSTHLQLAASSVVAPQLDVTGLPRNPQIVAVKALLFSLHIHCSAVSQPRGRRAVLQES
jgi:hypothetical protein